MTAPTRTGDAVLYQITYPRAGQAVTCPLCDSRPGEPCTSTGGGNHALVATHKARWARLDGWSERQFAIAHALVAQMRAKGLTLAVQFPAGFFDEAESAAAPVVVRQAKSVTPRTVRLSAQQARRVELAAHAGGTYYVSRAHFSGDAADRRSVQALEAKGILRHVRNTPDGYERELELTRFGWQVYHQHPMIRRLPDHEHPNVCPCRQPVAAGGAA